MATLLRILHLLALSMWLGSVTFFSFFTALPIIDHFRQMAREPDNWLGLKDEDQGTRVAGDALEPVFERYFPFQAACGVVALLTAAVWLPRPELVHKVRALVIALALLLCVINLSYLSPRVHDLRLQRYSSDVDVAVEARRAFSTWHTYSLVADMGTLALVVVGMALAAKLPADPQDAKARPGA